jgi:small GTP-binding protein
LQFQGHSYEQAALDRWLTNHNTSPLTNKELENRQFVLNRNLKSAIEAFHQQHNQYASTLNFRSFTLRAGRPQNIQWKHYPKLKVIISLLGPSNVGKSTLAQNDDYGQPTSNRKTVTLATDIRFFYLDRLFEDKFVVIVQLYDCPGDDRFESVSDRHFRNCHGAILMADTTDLESFKRLEQYWYRRLREKSSFDDVETVLACNKIDLLKDNCDLSYRNTFFRRADAFISSHQMPVFNISALHGENIQAMFQRLILNILHNEALMTHIKEKATELNWQVRNQASKVILDRPRTAEKSKNGSCCSRSS